MGKATPTDLQRALADEFGRQGWEYDMDVGASIVEEAERRGCADPVALASRASSTWIERNRTTRNDLAAAIERAIGGKTPHRPEQAPTTVLNFADNRSYTLHMESGAQIANSQVNLGGTQINIRADSPKAEVLAGVAALVRAGLTGEWNGEAARELATVIDGRDDVGLADVEATVAEIVEEESPEPNRARKLIESISAQGLGGALAIGITKGLAALIGLA